MFSWEDKSISLMAYTSRSAGEWKWNANIPIFILFLLKNKISLRSTQSVQMNSHFTSHIYLSSTATEDGVNVRTRIL